MLSVWFSGNTKPYKDDIKSLGGYSWSGRESANDWYSLSAPMMCGTGYKAKRFAR